MIRALLSCFIEITAEGGPQPLTPEVFCQAYITALHAQQPDIVVQRTDDLALTLQIADGEEQQIFLQNAYRDCSSPDELDAVVARYVNSALETFAQLEAAIDLARIVPVVKDKGYMKEARADAMEFDAHCEELNAELDVFYVLDTEYSMRYLGREELADAGALNDDLRLRAVENLHQLLPALECHGDAGTYMLTAGGTYEASLLLFDSIWTSENFDVDGDIVVAVPCRDMLLITGSEDDEALERLRMMAAKLVAEASYPLTEQFFVRAAGQWELFG